ncbi:hypothetical protein, partial [Micromonospora sp. NPDC049891]|uniref:magnesium chelatase subunit ChlI family protein n=1 Tax=Micromonospora sp. NPDC049891 TaxID=3155655 RepID=UPI0033E24304
DPSLRVSGIDKEARCTRIFTICTHPEAALRRPAEICLIRIHVLAWTIADLDGRARPDAGDVNEAITLRTGEGT